MNPPIWSEQLKHDLTGQGSVGHGYFKLLPGPFQGRITQRIINFHIERLPKGFYLATSNEIQGLIAQGRTVSETMEIARDVARRLMETQQERQHSAFEPELASSFDLPLVVGF